MKKQENSADSSLTIIIKRKAKPGKIEALEKWIRDVSEEALKFPGHLGYRVIHPDAHDNREFVIVFRFATYENMENWIQSDVRKQWLQKVDLITEGDADITTLPGLEGWFQLSDSEKNPAAPAKWKMAILIFVGLYPIAVGLGALSISLLPFMHPHPRQAIVLIVTIVIMTWLVMPFITKIFSGWLKNK